MPPPCTPPNRYARLLRAAANRARAALGRAPVFPEGVNLVGYARGGLGLGENLRRFAEAADHGGLPFALVDFDVNLGDRGRDTRLDAWIGARNPYGVNVFFINADQMPHVRERFDARFFAGRRNVGFWFWELERFPDDWLPALDFVDEVWVGSAFVREAVAARTRKPVRRIALPVEVPLPRRCTRAEFGLPEDRFVFVFSFDYHSYAQRKNPLGAIEAFRRAFPTGDARATLVVKSINGDKAPALGEAIRAEVRNDPRIVLLDAFLERDRAIGLVGVADCYLSLHRSEGFGLGMAEAMRLGKPVIATAWSGNLDFTRPDNSCLVDATLVPVGADAYPYGEGQRWADPDLDQAAAFMRRLVDEPAYARRIGAAGQAFVAEHHSAEACVRDLRAAIAAAGAGVRRAP